MSQIYWRSRCECVELWHADFHEAAPYFTPAAGYPRGVYIGDPPYGRDTHEVARQGMDLDGANRRTELGFAHLNPPTRRALAREIARLTERWAMVFSDTESAIFWRLSLLAARAYAGEGAHLAVTEAAHLEEERRLLRLLHDDYDTNLNEVAAGVLDYNVRCEWVKAGCTPSLNANGPAEGTEPFSVFHRKLTPTQRKAWQKHRRWNARGKRGVYTHPIERVERDAAVSTPKPTALIAELIADFTEPGETVYDLTAGGGTLGVAVLLANQAQPNLTPRHAVLVEVRETACAWAAERLAAAERGLDAKSAKKGQMGLLDFTGPK